MKVLLFVVALLAAALLAAPMHGWAQALGPVDGRDLPPADLERVKVGMAAPDFTLEDVHGNRVTLSHFQGQKKVVLVFYRGFW